MEQLDMTELFNTDDAIDFGRGLYVYVRDGQVYLCPNSKTDPDTVVVLDAQDLERLSNLTKGGK